jgi:hypothetical protein
MHAMLIKAHMHVLILCKTQLWAAHGAHTAPAAAAFVKAGRHFMGPPQLQSNFD